MEQWNNVARTSGESDGPELNEYWDKVNGEIEKYCRQRHNENELEDLEFYIDNMQTNFMLLETGDGFNPDFLRSDYVQLEDGQIIELINVLYMMSGVLIEINKTGNEKEKVLQGIIKYIESQFEIENKDGYFSLYVLLKRRYILKVCDEEHIFDDILKLNQEINEQIVNIWDKIRIKYREKDFSEITNIYSELLENIEKGRADRINLLIQRLKYGKDIMEDEKKETKKYTDNEKKRLFGIVDSILGKNKHQLLQEPQKPNYYFTEENMAFLTELLVQYNSTEMKKIRAEKYLEVELQYFYDLKEGFIELAKNVKNQLTVEEIEDVWNNKFYVNTRKLINELENIIKNGIDAQNLKEEMIKMIKNKEKCNLSGYVEEAKECTSKTDILLHKIKCEVI